MSTLISKGLIFDEKAPADGASTKEITDADSLDIHAKAGSLAAPVEDRRRFFWQRSRQPKQDLDSVATQPSVFDDPKTLEAYRPPPQYENTHRFDPDARWTWREERVRVAQIFARSTA